MKQEYIEISERSLLASEACEDRDIIESSLFYSYHAFESAGGALAGHFGRDYPLGHKKKINEFTTLSIKMKKQHAVGRVAIVLNSLRNAALYPEQMPDGSVQIPKNRMCKTDAKKLRIRVHGIVSRVKNYIK
jgi:hypothetical protein